MLKLKGLIGSLLLVAILTGCAGAGPKQTGGQLLGGAAGALLGSQFGKGSGRLFGVAIGALAGSYLGGSLGHAMDEKDRQMAQNTMLST
ncbi:MAG: glycine zipper 2TM domain-containing protein, partial [Gammaproteobacteria bacterium]|nr:glycine zipper 2TM domain-containing protein [Gammaproteobacteria bacterium]